ncbi:hypothetical protein BO94DRAFT_564922 [Aspergillus sclerotioniger CBS 115572]|uniref:PBP domain-containing protein n=1 Tax=Aspergillus sclerotioniger CBS 115572 TaxID=1450535 RepID=A0A317X006_9EURO|nr:hypothetical protein BO94DRAFT_564922 [Aspergillus sclerotioniger CBS 115572]PWY91605.1 hypothetical protein BO94DRAFT_564922 [Aspergillus sclerotioniger CBS 115572]
MSPSKITTIQQHGEIDSHPRETYGKGEVILRIGNGGAGATGLIRALAEDYLTLHNHPGSIQWICNHSRNTQLALFHGHIDLALTYERDQEDISISEGWAKNKGCIFHDHFCLAGPQDDPANVTQAPSIEDAFSRIATAQATFHNRSDGSATMWKERQIWDLCRRQPWNDPDAGWYESFLYTPSEAVTEANIAGAYLLCDRSTFLTMLSQGRVDDLRVFYEPDHSSDILMNSCYALSSPYARMGVAERVASFLAYLKSSKGQGVVARYGCDKVGVPLFASLGEGYAKVKLTGESYKGDGYTERSSTLEKL